MNTQFSKNRPGTALAKEQGSLSVLQRRILASHLANPATTQFNMSGLVQIQGDVDKSRLEKALYQVVASSAELRSAYRKSDDLNLYTLPMEKFRIAHAQIPQEKMDSWCLKTAKRPFLSDRPLVHLVIVQHEDDAVSFQFTMHHLVIDGGGFASFVRAVSKAYADPESWAADQTDPADPPHQIKARSKAIEYWNTRAPMELPNLQLRDRAPPTAMSERRPLPEFSDWFTDQMADLPDVYRLFHPGLQEPALILTAMASMVHLLSGSDRFSIGMPVNHRSTGQSDIPGGLRTEIFPVDVTVTKTDSFASLYQTVTQSLFTTLKNAIPDTSPQPDYCIVLNLIKELDGLNEFADMPARAFWLDIGQMDGEHAMRVHVSNLPKITAQRGATFELEINDDVLGLSNGPRLSGYFERIFKSMLGTPEQQLSDMVLCDDNELKKLAEWGNGGAQPVGAFEPLENRLQKALQNNPRIVITERSQHLSAEALWTKAQAFAAGLNSKSNPSDTRIAIILDPGIAAVVAIYGAVLAGCPFVTIDPKAPASRRDSMVQRAGCSVVIADPKDVDKLTQAGAGKAVDIDQLPQDREIYLLFTSGSTGQAKGVPIFANGLAQYLDYAVDTYFDGENPPNAALFGALNFDLTLTSVFAPILAGGQIEIFSGLGHEAMTQLATATHINWCKATPSHLQLLIRQLPDDHGLRRLIVGGEGFSATLSNTILSRLPGAVIHNEYGPTEAVIGCMDFQHSEPLSVDRYAQVPIGAPMPGVRLRVVNPYGQDCPVGVPGELWIARKGAALQYLGGIEPDRFVASDDQIFYRSGDLVRLNSALQLEYLGRMDDQIKISGIRIDPQEIETAIATHPAISDAVVRLWSTDQSPPPHKHCTRCGLPDNVPNVKFDNQGVCTTCHEFDRVQKMAALWFKSESDLQALVKQPTSASDYDCLMMLSGGKDSTFALCKLVEMGIRAYAVTLDNGYISENAKTNVRRITKDLNVDHEFITTPAMDEIFKDSLKTYSNVCQGCFKTIYTLATNRALDLGIPFVVSGLSRGQLFETRLIPRQFDQDRFDPDAIDQAVTSARKIYHSIDDAPNRLLDTSAFENGAVFQNITYVDFYRYIDVELSEMLEYLAKNTPWLRPEDTGRSTNCLINNAGIHTHLLERGYHNYAVPYAWDVRLGHKTRDEAIAELDDHLDLKAITPMLDQVGYKPAPKTSLACWFTLAKGFDRAPQGTELRNYLKNILPLAALPQSFMKIDKIPITQNGKLETRALPHPGKSYQANIALVVDTHSELEKTIIHSWERRLHVAPIGLDDDFFALGGDSLDALEVVIELSTQLKQPLEDNMIFAFPTVRQLAHMIEEPSNHSDATASFADIPALQDTPPPLSVGESSILFDQSMRPEALRYNVARVFKIAGSVDADEFKAALQNVIPLHQPLCWNYDQPRRELTPAERLIFTAPRGVFSPLECAERIRLEQAKPFDLKSGPALRCLILKRDDDHTEVAFIAHHVRCDHDSFDLLWDQICEVQITGTNLELKTDYAAFTQWQATYSKDADQAYWQKMADIETDQLPNWTVTPQEPDGFIIHDTVLSKQALTSGAGATGVAHALCAAASALQPFMDANRVEIGLVASARTHPASQPLFGYLLNTLPLPIRCDWATRFSDLSTECKDLLAECLPHRGYDLASMLADRRLAGQRHTPPSVLLAYDLAAPTRYNGQSVEQHVAFNGHSVARVSFFVLANDSGVRVGVEYCGRTIGRARGDRLAAGFAKALENAVQAPDAFMRDRDQTLLPVPSMSLPDKSAHLFDSIQQNCIQCSDKTAVICGDQAITWDELAQRATAIANQLSKAGLQQGDPVLVHQERSVTRVVALLGCWIAGAVYVPSDISYPKDRVESIVQICKCKIIITDQDLQLASFKTLIASDDLLDGKAWPENANPDPQGWSQPGPEDTAYILFTSGSTGTPMGVPISHSQISASTSVRKAAYDGAPICFMMPSGFAFDSSMVGVLWTLSMGGKLVLPTERQAHDFDALCGLIKDHAPSHLLCVPTLYDALLSRSKNDLNNWPDQVIVAGEACPPALVQKHFEYVPKAKLANEYGPTEASVWASVAHLRAEHGTSAVPIGVARPGTQIYLRSDDINSNTQGEILISGTSVSAGYINTQAPAADRFVEIDGQRVFRTGDLGQLRDGVLYYLGRVDDQLNIGGTRVEPGEIEAAIIRTRLVSQAAVVQHDPRSLDTLMAAASPDQLSQAMQQASDSTAPDTALRAELAALLPAPPLLVAHVVCSGDWDEDQLRSETLRHLSANFCPNRFIRHDALPLNVNGKVDRAALQALALADAEPQNKTSPASADSAPDIQHAVLTILQEELRNPRLKPDQSFFDHGGNSLQVMNVVLRLEQQFDIPVATSQLFDTPSAKDLAQALIAQGLQTKTPSTVQPAEARSLVIPLNRSGTKPPIFALHHLGENASFIRPLAQALGPDQPVFGLGVPRIIDRLSPYSSDPSKPFDMYEVSETYAKTIREMVPSGDFSLLGFCGGGVVAHEVAQQLHATGQTPKTCFVISDWHAPGYTRQDMTRGSTKIAMHWSLLKRAPMNYASVFVPGLLRIFARMPMIALRRAEIKLLHKKDRLPGFMQRRLEHRLALRDYMERGFNTLHSYKFERYAGRALIIRGADDPQFPKDQDETSWGDLLPDQDIVRIPGFFPMFAQFPYVNDLAKVIAQELENLHDRS